MTAWLLREDEAVKQKLQGLSVTDANAPTGRPVTVRFRLPEQELGDLRFPAIIITRLSLTPAHDREHRGMAGLLYTPASVPTWDPTCEDADTTPFVVDYPVPMDVLYQITVMARKQQHLMSIVAALAGIDRLPARFGYITVPDDGTVRSLFLDAGPEFDESRDGDDKRLFRAHYTIRIPTEQIPEDFTRSPVSEVEFDFDLEFQTYNPQDPTIYPHV